MLRFIFLIFTCLSIVLYLNRTGIEPDGKTIAWYRAGRIWLMNADGSNQRFLAEGASPAWCPDSKHIVYSKPSNNGKFGKFKFYFLWKLNIETGKENQITKEF